VIDLTVASLLIILLSWVFILVILIYGITGRPIFFRQQRIGRNERSFTILKFRTLVDGPEDVQTRRFPFGSFLRMTSIDELPQLINILKGEMSLIGPRPLPVGYLHLFSSFQRRRHAVRPGITGLAQVNGRTEISWQKKFELDVQYVEQMSFLLDMRIAIQTIALLLSFRQDVSLEEKPFTGEE
jgi:lipopolysaccharide/colanic/teichoic acid biosynthesis glycosyltransferase